MKAFTELL